MSLKVLEITIHFVVNFDFKLNPGPDNSRITTFVSLRDDTSLRSLPCVIQTPNFTFNRSFAASDINAGCVCKNAFIIKDFVADYRVDLHGITKI